MSDLGGALGGLLSGYAQTKLARKKEERDREDRMQELRIRGIQATMSDPTLAPQDRDALYDELHTILGDSKKDTEKSPLRALGTALEGLMTGRKSGPVGPTGSRTPDSLVRPGEVSSMPGVIVDRYGGSAPPADSSEALADSTLPPVPQVAGAGAYKPRHFRDPLEMETERETRRAAARTAELTAQEAIKARHETALTELKHKEDLELETLKGANALRRQEAINTQKVTKGVAVPATEIPDLAETAAPWERVREVFHADGTITYEPASPMAKQQGFLDRARAGLARAGNISPTKEDLTGAYNKIVDMDNQQEAAKLVNRRGQNVERTQRMKYRNLNYELAQERQSSLGGRPTQRWARSALGAISAETTKRQKDPNDPLSTMPYAKAEEIVAKDFNATPEDLATMRKAVTTPLTKAPRKGEVRKVGPASYAFDGTKWVRQ
jgi:hypothetical protein